MLALIDEPVLLPFSLCDICLLCVPLLDVAHPQLPEGELLFKLRLTQSQDED